MGSHSWAEKRSSCSSGVMNTGEGLGPTVVNSTMIDIAARGLCGVEKLPTDKKTKINDVNVPRLELGCLPRYDMSKATGI
ncbi:hypothetical protein BCON_0108g00310 [Botryotinia convoluta]|uniref:Uncharacterized protein n=1 Tax=Botryotinia convoluta TaxID=54673 RepID=A0A4Z1I0R2_9HELO|nr:hypothetical protein BCON_0108g00310 [Botryotinia convoluta]